MNEPDKTNALPDRNSEYFLYQTLIGAWPISPDRIKAYMQKAMREAKQQTSWVANNKDFEDALNNFIDVILADTAFTADLESFVERILLAGRINSLTQTLLKQTSPGVPDLYQGSELWDLSLVDPDNRRPVDYELRRKLLAELPALCPAEILLRMDEGTSRSYTSFSSPCFSVASILSGSVRSPHTFPSTPPGPRRHTWSHTCVETPSSPSLSVTPSPWTATGTPPPFRSPPAPGTIALPASVLQAETHHSSSCLKAFP